MQNAKAICFLIILTALCSSSGYADDCFRCTSGFVYGDIGGNNMGDGLVFLQLGGGIERTMFHGWTLGAEVGLLGPYASFEDAPIILSAQTTYGFFRGREGANLIPFIGAGYSISSQKGLANYPHLSAGIDLWKYSQGLRIEYRMYFWEFESQKSLARSVRCAYLVRW